MRYHLVFTIFFIHLFFLFNIYIKDEISAPENYVTCPSLEISAESIKCHQQQVTQSKQFLHYITQWDSLDEASHHEMIDVTKTSIRFDELELERMKLRLGFQEVNGKIAQITDATPPRIISALQRQRKHIINKFDDHFDRFDKFNEKADVFYATISYD
ncbi:MAG: hypothetical protein K0U39_05510 [Alphaproteobacteria bacterium]|nr:hypothetical protein [Alphaproteobacteria bacterium]